MRSLSIELAWDKTGFPCLRQEGMPDFVAMLPVTKLQAEEWIWREGVAGHDGVVGLVERLEVRSCEDLLPPAVQRLERLPIGKLSSRTALSVLASNLSLWTPREQARRLGTTFPTATSEWGLLLRWLGGRVPRYEEWRRTQDAFAPVRTEDLLREVLQRCADRPPAVQRLLSKLCDLVPRDARGLPFMGRGLYELIADTEQVERLIGGVRKEVRPQVVGDSPVWPSLNTAVSMAWRPLRSSALPVVAVRPWFAEREITAAAPTRGSDLLQVAAQQAEVRSLGSGGGRTAIRRAPLKPYVKSDDRMRQRCPHCHQRLAAAVFKSHSTFDCIKTRVEDAGEVKTVREHKYAQDAQGVVISKQYLDVAKAYPDRIHTVAVAGYTWAGKTTFLLSFGGLLDYPDACSAVYSSFPASWDFTKRSLAIHDRARGGGAIDRKAATEALWLDGILPIRTEQHGEGVRDQLLFRSKPAWRQREVVLILDDMAGEAVSDPKMVTNENYPHFASIADVIYVVAADDMSAAVMEEFVKRLEQANSEGVPIDLSRTNLIFVISKIDQLKYGGPAERDLFGRILPHPERYRLPRHQDAAELKSYIEEMEEVHHQIGDWLREHKPEFFSFFAVFGSVRFCGISAFGFQPTKEPEASEHDHTLAFHPDPVRVVDPVFWLLKENGLIEF